MTIWLALLVGCVMFGLAVVGALVLPPSAAPVIAGAGLAALVGAVSAFGTLAQRYGSPEAILLAMLVFIAGIVAGFAIGASALPHLAPPARPVAIALGTSGDTAAPGVVLIGCAEPETYRARVVAARQNLLAENADIEIPTSAQPFVYFAEKTRYRAAGGRAPGPAEARELALRVTGCLGEDVSRVELAWCHDASSLAAAVASLTAAGVDRIGAVVLGAADSAPVDELRRTLDDALRGARGPQITFGPAVWNDRALPARLAARILAATALSPSSEVGVVLVDQGRPPTWERRYAAAGAVENYFDQRVRALLAESGLSDQHIRVAWLDWQTPDVTEAVRHLAALGCTRIVVAAATIALPTLETVLDLSHAISSARVPAGVRVVTVSPWGADEGFVDAVCTSAREALGLSAGKC